MVLNKRKQTFSVNYTLSKRITIQQQLSQQLHSCIYSMWLFFFDVTKGRAHERRPVKSAWHHEKIFQHQLLLRPFFPSLRCHVRMLVMWQPATRWHSGNLPRSKNSPLGCWRNDCGGSISGWQDKRHPLLLAAFNHVVIINATLHWPNKYLCQGACCCTSFSPVLADGITRLL